MHQLTQLASEVHHQRLAHADQQRPAERLLALSRATRRAERAERRMRRAARQTQRLRASSRPRSHTRRDHPATDHSGSL
jgi:hypothetical protein